MLVDPEHPVFAWLPHRTSGRLSCEPLPWNGIKVGEGLARLGGMVCSTALNGQFSERRGNSITFHLDAVREAGVHCQSSNCACWTSVVSPVSCLHVFVLL
jgi:hypothetical protein